MAKIKCTDSRSVAKLNKLLELLVTPMDCDELAPHMCITASATYAYLYYAKSQKLIHICGWKTNGEGSRKAIFTVGNLPDAKKPSGIPKRDLNVRAWKRLKKDKEKYEEYKGEKNRAYRKRNFKPFRDPLMTWIQP